MAASPGPRQRPQVRRSAANGIEKQVHTAACYPAPGDYDPYNPVKPENTEPKRLGKISDAQLPSPLDHIPRSKAYVPGPAAYTTSGSFVLPEGGRVNRNPPPDRVRIDEYPQPAPGQYGAPNNPANPRSTLGKFSRDPRVSKFIMDEVNRTRSIPGPGAHDVMDSMECAKPFCPEGGRCLMASKPMSYFEKAPLQAEGKPGPDRYDLPGAVKGNKGHGRLVYRYQSSTLAESRALINRVVGEANVAPGPGAYDLPDPPPLNNAPTFMSRKVPHAMPHPFAYNCQPDYARNFTTPVRAQNSNNQIYGTGVRAADVAKRSKKASRPSSAGSGEAMQAHELPPELRGVEAESEDAVQWRSGGFTALKKSKSSPAFPKQEHPSVAACRSSYPLLSAKHRENTTFRPMASKRNASVSTHESSEENQCIRRSKWQLAAVAEGLKNATAAVLEKPDLDKMREDAMEVCRNKAHERMKLEGMSYHHISRVLDEMSGVLDDRRYENGIQRPQPSQEASEQQRQQEAAAEEAPSGVDDAMAELEALGAAAASGPPPVAA